MRVGILTSGGDCQSLNATMRSVVKGLCCHEKDVEIYGITDGYTGLIYGKYKKMSGRDFSGILNCGGTILGTSRQPFKKIRIPDENGIDKVEAMKTNYKKWELDCLVILGGNGTHKTANLLREEGLNVVTLPKTIDNDIWGTDVTFGFHSAVSVAAKAIDELHTTAASHSRVLIAEVMGHKVGWMTLYAGVAAGADVILVPEIPYEIEKVAEAVEKRKSEGKRFTILAVAEGAISKEKAAMTKKQLKALREKENYPSVAYEVADALEKLISQDIRVNVLGHVQRGGAPVAYDRVIATRLGAKAAELIYTKQYGNMAAIVDGNVVAVPLEEVAGKLKVLTPEEDMILQAKEIGICFGD